MSCFTFKIITIKLLLYLGVWLISAYRQSDYKVIHHYAKIVYFHPDYISEAKVYNVKPNRTYRAFSSYHCQKVDVGGNTLKLNVHGYTAIPYLKDTPVQFDIKLCDMFEKNIFGVQEVFKHSNYTKCPLKKGCYVMNNFVLSESYFPPYLPPNEYVFKFKLFYENVLVGQMDWRGEIQKRLI